MVSLVSFPAPGKLVFAELFDKNARSASVHGTPENLSHSSLIACGLNASQDPTHLVDPEPILVPSCAITAA